MLLTAAVFLLALLAFLESVTYVSDTFAAIVSLAALVLTIIYWLGAEGRLRVPRR